MRQTDLRVNAPAGLMDFLLSKMGGMKRNSVKSLLTHRQVSVNGEFVTRHDHPLQPGDTVTVSSERGNTPLTHPKVRVIYEDPYLIVIEKKENLLTVRTDNGHELTAFSILKNHVQKASDRNRIYTVAIVLITLLICYSRIYLACHFPMDLLLGLAVGVISGFGMYFLWKKLDKVVARLSR